MIFKAWKANIRYNFLFSAVEGYRSLCSLVIKAGSVTSQFATCDLGQCVPLS